MSGRLYKGDLYLAVLDSNLGFNGYLDPINGTQLEIGQTSEEIRVTSQKRANWGQALATAYKPNPASIKVAINEAPAEILRMAFLGDIADLSEGAGSVADESITLTAAKMDKWLDLSKRNITAAGFQVQDVTDTTTYVLNTDYEVNYRLGKIKILSSGSIGSTDVIHIDFDHSAVSGKRIQGGLVQTINARLLLDGQNVFTGVDGILTVYQAALTPDTPIDFYSSEPISVGLTGTLTVPAGQDHPFDFEDREYS